MPERGSRSSGGMRRRSALTGRFITPNTDLAAPVSPEGENKPGHECSWLCVDGRHYVPDEEHS